MNEVSSPPPRVVVPSAVTNAIRMTWVVLALTGVTALLTFLFRDDLVLHWAEGNPEAQRLIDSGGLTALEESAISVPAFAPLAIWLFVTFAALAVVLTAFVRGGHNWARHSLAALVVFAGFGTGVSMTRDLPPVFLGLAVLSLVAYLVLLWLLYHKDTNAFIKSF